MLKSIIGLFLVSSALFSLTHYEVAKKSEEKMSGFKDSVSKMQMILVNAAGQEKTRTMKMKVFEGKIEDKSLMEFVTPADVRGTKFLSYEHVDKDDDQWLYLPALKRVKRIASKNKSGSFMGSEFSYEDLSASNVNKYIYKDGKCQLVNLGSKSVYKSISKPRSKYSGYTKLISYIDAKTFLIQKIEYYDRKKELYKVANFEKYKNFGDVYRIGKITMQNLQNNKSTILVWKNEKIKNGLKERDFHKRYLK
jgi:Outer membrane lipoprotein-sorting protein